MTRYDADGYIPFRVKRPGQPNVVTWFFFQKDFAGEVNPTINRSAKYRHLLEGKCSYLLHTSAEVPRGRNA